MLKVTKRKSKGQPSKLPHDGNKALDKDDVKVAAIEAPCTALISTPGTTEGENLPIPAPDTESMPEVIKRKRLRMTGKHLPLVNCNTCLHSDTCLKYKSGYECAYTKDFLKRINTIADVKDLMRGIAEADLMRAQQAIMFEQMSGGVPGDATTTMLDSAFDKLRILHDMVEKPDPDEKKGKGVVEALFGAMMRNAKPIEAEATVHPQEPNKK